MLQLRPPKILGECRILAESVSTAANQKSQPAAWRTSVVALRVQSVSATLYLFIKRKSLAPLMRFIFFRYKGA